MVKRLLFVDAKNNLTDKTEKGDFSIDTMRGMKPVVIDPGQDNKKNPADAYFVNNFIDRSHKDPKDPNKPQCFLTVWSLVGNDLIPKLYPINPFTADIANNDWKFILNAAYRDGSLYATFQEGGPNAGKLWSIRMIRVNMLNQQVDPDRSFGLNNVDDKPSDRFDYTYPGIQVNKHGDIVVVYARYSHDPAKQRMEVRFSVKYHNEPDIRPSRLLKAGEAIFKDGTDTAGIAVDPDDEAIWIAHSFAAKDSLGNGYKKIAFGKVFGTP